MANPVQVYKRDATWRKGVFRTLATDIIVHGKVLTTEDKAKAVKRYVDKLITKAKKNTLASRRKAEALLRPVEVDGMSVGKYLFTQLGPKYVNRSGGYTRIIKAPNRRGDNAKMAYIELVK